MNRIKTALAAIVACAICAGSAARAEALLPGQTVIPDALPDSFLSGMTQVGNTGTFEVATPGVGNVQVDSAVYQSAATGDLTFTYDFLFDGNLSPTFQPDATIKIPSFILSANLEGFAGTATDVGFVEGAEQTGKLYPDLASRDASGNTIQFSYSPVLPPVNVPSATLVVSTNATAFTQGNVDFTLTTPQGDFSTDPTIFVPVSPGSVGVPEISGSGLGAAMILLAGVLALQGDRARRPA